MKRGISEITSCDSNPKDPKEEEPEAKRATISDQASITKRILDGESLFYTGAAGTGKTYLLKNVIGKLDEKHGDDSVFVTAPTGIAACHIEGVTIHSFAGLPPLDNPSVDYIVKNTMKKKNIVERWKAAKVLIIDECSMVDPIIFDGMDMAARTCRKQMDVPFGGIQVVLCGDFLQLKPVIKSAGPVGGKERPTYLFESNAWEQLIGTTHVYELHEMFRQSDPEFLSALAELRVGKLSPKSRIFFWKLSENVFPPDAEVVDIYTTRDGAAVVNSEHLLRLPGPTVSFEAKDFEPGKKSYGSGTSKYFASKKKAGGESSLWMAPDVLELRVGAQVMLLKNLVPGLLVNGTTGIVVGFDESTSAPIVTFTATNGTKHTMTMAKAVWERKMGRVVVAKRTQYPLILSYAITTHKSQGMSLKCVRASTSGAFEPGQTYVAVSRATTPEGLKLEGPIGRIIAPDERVIGFYKKCNLTLAI